ncbi:uncharacterized protein [Dysidea avara]|uniref:uncharacterized protein isoform X2 n=1 Tax=Dysidea avara TaxID=196820 RepID=UPI00331D13D7
MAYTTKGLIWAAECGKLEDVRKHLDNGVYVDSADGWAGNTALLFAVKYNHLQVVKLLLSRGAGINQTNNFAGESPLHIAANNNHAELSELLLVSGAAINVKDKSGETPLHKAVRSCQLKLVQMLLSKGADVSSTNNFAGESPLHIAVNNNHVELAELLLVSGAAVNVEDKSSETPLHKAVRSGQLKLAQMLLSKGADVSSTNNVGDTPSSLAVKARDTQMVELLLSHGAEVDNVTGGRKQLVLIRQRKKHVTGMLQRNLDRAKSQGGKIPVRFIKLLFTGSGAAGKTSFSNLLMKNKISKVHHSTGVVNARHAVSVRKGVLLGSKEVDTKGVVWFEMDIASEIAYFRQVLLSSRRSVPAKAKPSSVDAPQRSSSSDNKHKQTDNAVKSPKQLDKPPSPGNQNTALANPPSSVSQSISSWFSKPKVKSDHLETFDTVVNDALHSHLSVNKLIHRPGEVLNIITLLDTGGQPEYIHLLPTVNVNPMVNFIVHDLSKGLKQQVLVEYSEHGQHIFEPYHLRYSNLDMIKFLMSSVNDSLEKPSCQVPQLVKTQGKNTTSYLCCIGTHSDRVTSESIQATDNTLTEMVEILDCKAAVWQNKEGGILFPVNNTTAGSDKAEDPIAELIRNKIEMLASEKEVYELPITWMLFELEVRQVCSKQNKSYISFQECISIALRSKLITDIEQIKSALLYHHLLGVLLYYSEVPGLCDYVIIDHQWLFDKLSSIVSWTFRPSSNIRAKNKLKYDGILSKELLQELNWTEELKEEYFLSLLVEMKIIAPIQRDDGAGDDYFIPYVLPTCTSQSQSGDILSQYGYLQGEPLLIQFISNLLPRGFFCCLVVQIIQQLPKDWNPLFFKKDTYHTYSNLTTFRLPGAYCLSLMDKLSYLEIQIRHTKSEQYLQHPIHLTVQDVLGSALAIVCVQLNFNHGRIRYGFHCQCVEKEEEHFAELAKLTPPFDYAQCRCGSTIPTELKHSHVVWFTEDKQYLKQTTHQSQTATQSQTDYQSPEFKVFIDYYNKLVHTLLDCNLFHYFVSEYIISLTDHEEITKPTTLSVVAVEFLLNRISVLLQSSTCHECFHKVLAIMENHGNIATEKLSREIRVKLAETREIVNSYTVTPDTSGPSMQYPSSPEIAVSSNNQLGIEDEDEITKPTTPSIRAATLLLSRVANPLSAGFENCTDSFYKFLEITEKHGSQDNSDISQAIRKKLSELATANDTKTSVCNVLH